MARRYASAELVLACFFASIITGLAQTNNAAAGTASALASRAMEFANVVYEKLSECIGSTDALMPMVAAAAVAGLALYALSRYFDRDPFLFDSGKLGKLEAQSVYLKKNC